MEHFFKKIVTKQFFQFIVCSCHPALDAGSSDDLPL